MHQHPEVPTITKSAPPSYAEATGEVVSPMRDDHNVPLTGPSYGLHPQVSPYPHSMSGYHNENNFYPTVVPQPPYNPAYMPVNPYTQQPATAPVSSTATAQCIVRTEHVERNQCCCCCTKKCGIFILCILLIAYVIKVVVSHVQ